MGRGHKGEQALGISVMESWKRFGYGVSGRTPEATMR